MDKNVIISVRGTQSTNNQVNIIMELVTEGKYYKKMRPILSPMTKAK